MKKGEPVTTGFAVTRLGELVELPVEGGLIVGWVQGKFDSWHRSADDAKAAAEAITAKNGGAA